MSETGGVWIGDAAALYGLAPSTLRWWESQQVLPEPPRANGRRVYTESDLRRIGLAYLCCITSAMPLEQAAVVISGRSNDQWQRTVRGHAGALERKILELQSAHEYLMHLLECPDDDIVDKCPWLDSELLRHTPRGRAPAGSFVDAARSGPQGAHAPHQRDETTAPRDEKEIPFSRCIVCATSFAQSGRGRRRLYCSHACRQRRYRETAAPHPAPSAADADASVAGAATATRE